MLVEHTLLTQGIKWMVRNFSSPMLFKTEKAGHVTDRCAPERTEIQRSISGNT